MVKWGDALKDKSSPARKLLIDGELLDACCEVGWQRFIELGHYVYGEIAKAMAAKVAPVVVDQNEVNFRGTTHLLMMWDKAWYKSTIVDTFLGQGLNQKAALLYIQPTKEKHHFDVCPTHALTPARFRGSFSEGVFLPPYPAVKDVLYIDELISFLGAGDNRTEMIANLNTIIESGRGSTSLVKMAAMTEEHIPAHLHDMIWVDPVTKEVKYIAKATMIIATHHLKPQVISDLDEQGFLSRMKILSVQLTTKEKLDYQSRLAEKRKPAQYSLSEIRDAWSIYFSVVYPKVLAAPPEDYVKRGIAHVLSLVEREAGGLIYDDAVDALGGRLTGTIQRDILNHALLKQFERIGEIPEHLKEIIYDDEDLDYAFNQIEISLDSIRMIQKAVEKGEPKTKKDNAEEIILGLLGRYYPDWVGQVDLVAAICNQTNVHRSGVYAAVTKLLFEEKIERRRVPGGRGRPQECRLKKEGKKGELMQESKTVQGAKTLK